MSQDSTVYASAEALYGRLQTLFARLEAENPQAADKLLKSQLRIRLRCSGPMAEIMLDAKERPLQIYYGPQTLKPDLDIEVTTSALHRILLGELSLTKALGSKELKPNGPIFKAMALGDLFRHLQKIYPQLV